MAVAALVLVPARAFPCGSNSSGGSDSGGSSSDSGSSDSGGCDFDFDDTSSSDVSEGCHDTTDVIGRAECRRFGAWSVGRTPRLRIEMGGSMHSFSLAGMSFSGVAEHDTAIRYRMAGEHMSSSGAARAWTTDVRVTTAIGRHGYAGGQVSIGAAFLTNPAPVGSGALTLEPDNGLYATVAAVAGLSYYLGKWTLRSEAQVGHRFVSLDVTSRHGDCVDRSAVSDQQWQLRPQASLETWLSPWITAGAALSTDMLHEGDMAMSVFIGGHLRAYDASRSRR
jgi:hypothetical protein